MSVKIKARTRVLVANAIGNLKLSLAAETYHEQEQNLLSAANVVADALGAVRNTDGYKLEMRSLEGYKTTTGDGKPPATK